MLRLLHIFLCPDRLPFMNTLCVLRHSRSRLSIYTSSVGGSGIPWPEQVDFIRGHFYVILSQLIKEMGKLNLKGQIIPHGVILNQGGGVLGVRRPPNFIKREKTSRV